MWGRLDLPDALALDAAVTDGARVLAELGSVDPLGARRSRALGDLARCQPGLDLTAGADGAAARPASSPPSGGDVTGGRRRDALPGRVRSIEPVVLYLHLSAAALATGVDDGSGEVENTRCPVPAEQIRTWCARPGARVSVKPVIDLNQDAVVASREVPDWMRERVALRDRTCVFPHCSRPARPYAERRVQPEERPQHRRGDVDHITPHCEGGPTSTDNTAPLCRVHHLLKTFAGWRYEVTGRRSYQWTSPHRLRYLRTPDGATHDVDPVPRAPARPGWAADRRAVPRALQPPRRALARLPHEREPARTGAVRPATGPPPPF